MQLKRAVLAMRLHPWFRLDDRHVERTHTPTLRGTLDVPTERLREDLVAETNADERLTGIMYVAHEAFERFDPFVLVVHGKARAGAYVDVASIRRDGNVALTNVEPCET